MKRSQQYQSKNNRWQRCLRLACHCHANSIMLIKESLSYKKRRNSSSSTKKKKTRWSLIWVKLLLKSFFFWSTFTSVTHHFNCLNRAGSFNKALKGHSKIIWKFNSDTLFRYYIWIFPTWIQTHNQACFQSDFRNLRQSRFSK